MQNFSARPKKWWAGMRPVLRNIAIPEKSGFYDTNGSPIHPKSRKTGHLGYKQPLKSTPNLWNSNFGIQTGPQKHPKSLKKATLGYILSKNVSKTKQSIRAASIWDSPLLISSNVSKNLTWSLRMQLRKASWEYHQKQLLQHSSLSGSSSSSRYHRRYVRPDIR